MINAISRVRQFRANIICFRRKKRGYPIEELRMLAFCVNFNLI